MKRKALLMFFALLVCIPVFSASAEPAEEKKLPEVGKPYQLDGQQFKVVAGGKETFEYKATGESLAVLMETTAISVIVPNKGEVVKIDPSEPMMWVAGKKHNAFETNGYIQKNGKDAHFALLEYNRSAN